MLIYFDRPQKWLFVPLIVIGLVSIHAMDIESIRARIKVSPGSYLAVFITIFMVCGSFGYGRSQAQGLAQNKAANVHVTIESNLLKTRLLGKISSYYFFLGMDGKISQYPESSVKLIVYEKTF